MHLPRLESGDTQALHQQREHDPEFAGIPLTGDFEVAFIAFLALAPDGPKAPQFVTSPCGVVFLATVAA